MDHIGAEARACAMTEAVLAEILKDRCVLSLTPIGPSVSLPRNAVDKALDEGGLLLSEATGYVSQEGRTVFLSQLESVAEFVPIIQMRAP
jgi:hypothetical protein